MLLLMEYHKKWFPLFWWLITFDLHDVYLYIPIQTKNPSNIKQNKKINKKRQFQEQCLFSVQS